MEKITLFTSYFGNSRALAKEDVLMIGISRYPPSWYQGVSMFELAPHSDMLRLSSEEYDKAFQKRVLGVTDRKTILEKIQWFSKHTGKTKIALCCFEKEQKECHRYNVAVWLQEGGIQIEEFKQEVVPETPKVIDTQMSMFD